MADVKSMLEEIDSRVMGGLKDFQQKTVERIDYLFRSGKMRVLVSDEVGLGKTLIARGTISKLALQRREANDNLVKVVYICSNGAIADQNLAKLMISNDLTKESTGTSRLSMQHLNIFKQEHNKKILDGYIQLIPLTPETSFRMASNTGKAAERALMYRLLYRIEELKPYLEYLDVIMKDRAVAAWSYYVDFYEKEILSCDEISGGEYLRYMMEKIREQLFALRAGGDTYFKQIVALCEEFKRNRNKKISTSKVIAKLRVMFAQISLDKLEPDLVIMDEFQRFKYLINADAESETGMLAKKFFSANDVKMLLLSATPYKMYSTLDEIDETQVDEHYSEFLDVMRFLNTTDKEHEEFKTVWNDYSVKLKELSVGDVSIIAAKKAAEDAMYSHVCRTERISASEGADMIDASEVKHYVDVVEQDIKSFVQAQKLLEDIGLSYSVPVDYVKSCPYLLSFMVDYKLKRDIEKYFRERPSDVAKLNRDTFWINRSAINKYSRLPVSNARLDRVSDFVFKSNAEKLLWVPPSRAYYEPTGAFKDSQHFSKTLVFSSWEMVPRMLASLLSYEAERKTVGVLAKRNDDKEIRYFKEGNKRYPIPKLRFAVKEGAPNTMALFCLLYPSRFLAELYNPIDCMNRGLSLKDIEKEIKQKLIGKLERLKTTDSGVVDKRWYYLAPMFMDGKGDVSAWLSADPISDYLDEDENQGQKMFKTHWEALKSVYFENCYPNKNSLGRQPDDLVSVLTTMAIASPAVCMYRAYTRYGATPQNAMELGSKISRVFMNYMNSPEATAVIEVCYGKTDDAHWIDVLNYCKSGNLQAMFDEYAHLITNVLDRDDKLVERMHNILSDTFRGVKTTIYKVDTLPGFKAKIDGRKEKETRLRTHFAVAFTKGIGEKDADRKKLVRNAFNSPLRPFVLASTSIGQEGLDFHNYCRRIVHWNLPSNPIDLEQREGRINRFECLAIRQNIADRYGSIGFQKDIWGEMFDEAVRKEKVEGCSDLIPYWGLTEREDMIRIERIVPMYPFSHDGIAYDRLIKILSLYRLTLGQARQEELLEYIFKNYDGVEDMKEFFINLSPYYKLDN